jgi:hypothetical protein
LQKLLVSVAFCWLWRFWILDHQRVLVPSCLRLSDKLHATAAGLVDTPQLTMAKSQRDWGVLVFDGCLLTTTRSRNDPHLPKTSQLTPEAYMCVDRVSETGVADLDCAQDRLFTEVEHPVHKRPVRNLFVWSCMQFIASHYPTLSFSITYKTPVAPQVLVSA